MKYNLQRVGICNFYSSVYYQYVLGIRFPSPPQWLIGHSWD